MPNTKQKDVIQDITEQTLLTLDGVAEEISKQTVQEEVDNFIAERTLKENPDEVVSIANKVKEYKKGDKTNFGVVVAVSPSSITFKSKDVPNDPGGIGTKIVFNARKMGSKDYVLSSLRKINESMYEYSNTMEHDEEMEEDEADDQEVEVEVEEETIESLAAKLELTDEQVETLAAKCKEKYEEEGDAVLLDMLKIVAMPTDEEHKSAMMELIVNGDFDALEAHIAEMKAQEDSEEGESEKEESEMNEGTGDFKTLEAYVTVVEKLLGKKASNIEKGTNKYSDDSKSDIRGPFLYNYITFQISQSSFQVQGKSDGVYVGFMGLGVYSKSDIRGPFDSPKDFENEMTKEESNMKVDTTDIDELVKDEEGLTEGFKEKASIIFEAAVASKVKATKSLLKEQYATRLQEEVEVLKENLVEKIDSYLTYAVETWVNDNQVAVESTLRTEITESFIGSLKNIFTEHYIEVPESKVNFVANMEAQLSSLKEQVDKKGRIANELADRVEKLTRQKVIAEASTGLADTQIAKLTELVEDVEFINENTFTKKVGTIREFYINNRNSKHTLNENVDDNASFISKETIVENQIEGDSVSPSMQNYLSAMSRMNKATTANLVM